MQQQQTANRVKSSRHHSPLRFSNNNPLVIFQSIQSTCTHCERTTNTEIRSSSIEFCRFEMERAEEKTQSTHNSFTSHWASDVTATFKTQHWYVAWSTHKHTHTHSWAPGYSYVMEINMKYFEVGHFSLAIRFRVSLLYWHQLKRTVSGESWVSESR